VTDHGDNMRAPPIWAVRAWRCPALAPARNRQALYRLLLHAASQRVFASLHTQPLEDAAARGLIRSQLTLPGHPQMLLQFGPATTSPTGRRPAAEPDAP
jgi:hypothetical protein